MCQGLLRKVRGSEFNDINAWITKQKNMISYLEDVARLILKEMGFPVGVTHSHRSIQKKREKDGSFYQDIIPILVLSITVFV